MKVKDNIVKGFYKTAFKAKKASPEICLVSGIVGLGVATVMLCKTTTKADDILEEHKKNIEKVHECKNLADKHELTQEYTEQDYRKDLARTYFQMSVKMAKRYAPAAGLWLLSMGLVVSSHKILRKRNLALAAAYSTIDHSFKNYRKSVVEKFGEKTDKELRYGIKAQEVEEKVEKDGKEKTVKKKVDIAVPDLNDYSDYARFFDASSREWTKDPEYNLMFLKTTQAHFNDILKIRGYVFLNDVYERLDLPKTLAGQCVGWVYNKNNPDSDNVIDFGIYGSDGKINEANVRFVNGYENVIVLDFNVDGNILDEAF